MPGKLGPGAGERAGSLVASGGQRILLRLLAGERVA